ncbi:MAG TPA: LodA/GoxA family CTQ-dependent oxidase [Pyrinomonadaceae bacterium]|nr:LodA/GoxA family CTQ-dependent oxidase [Pyrinomonadaceae bacterium]
MATVFKIHPAIGIARVGNSPDEFFVGPERIGEEPSPHGGFKDAQCRVKRQAARFRIFAHHDNGTVEEITKAEADITWIVHLVNKKAANPGRNNTESVSDLTIDPGTRTLNGSNQRKLFDTGQIKFSGAPVTTVPLGEIRSDTNNHLLVLGGFGKSGSPAGTALDSYFWASDDWYDDVSDGPVTASIKLLADNSTPAVMGAWVIVAPPKFAPNQESVITLYDRVFQAMVDGGFITAPITTSYTNDVYRILQHARDTGWVDQTFGSHTWSDPVISNTLRNAIFNKLKAPGGGGGNMPVINDSGTQDDRLTPTQYAHMQRWKDNNFTNDWAGVPSPQADITPDGLDRAALEACVGGAFFPGIEAGGLDGARPLLVAANFVEPFRLNQTVVAPGDITYVMALPWQNDFYQCADNWWPVPRPNYVIRQGMSNQSFISGVVSSGQEMVDNWHKLGFVLRQGSQHVELDRCDIASINLLTPLLNFQDVPQGPMGMMREMALAITFEVISPSNSVTLQYAPGGAPSHPQLVAFNSSVTVGPTPANGLATARLWVIYRTSNAGDVLPPQTVTVQDSAGTQSWTITIIGNTVARKTAAAALVLDRSGSMSDDRGDGQTKHASLQQATSIFVDVMLEGDGVGLVRFNQDAQVLQAIVQLGNGGLSDIVRNTTKDIINGTGLDPDGQTSIGDGIFEGRGILNSTATPFDVKALVVLTDGIENRARSIAEVAPQINEYTYAVGLGQPQNISVPALQNISGNNGGYLLVTGAISTDNRFLLQKYFLQILAGISNAEIVLDPEGQLIRGRVERIPFQLTNGDAGVDVILLTPNPRIVDFRLQAPSGDIIEPWRALSEPGMRFVLSDGVSYYRLVLPTEFMPNRFDGGGTWHALLTIGDPRLKRSDTRDGVDHSIRHRMFASLPHIATAPAGSAQRRRAVMLAAETFSTAAFAGMSTRASATAAQGFLPYSLVVHAYSNISLQAHVEQSGFEPGAFVELYASVAQSGVPLPKQAQVWVEVQKPDGSAITVMLSEYNEGQFKGELATSRPGVYRLHFRATGTTLSGEPFTRERLLTAAVWRGVDRPGPVINGHRTDDDRDARLCELLKCLLNDGVITPEFEKWLHGIGLDVNRARKCLTKLCRDN